MIGALIIAMAFNIVRFFPGNKIDIIYIRSIIKVLFRLLLKFKIKIKSDCF